MTSYLVSAPVPDAVDGQSDDARPRYVASRGVTNEAEVVVTWVAARVIASQRRVGHSALVLIAQSVHAAHLDEACTCAVEGSVTSPELLASGRF